MQYIEQQAISQYNGNANARYDLGVGMMATIADAQSAAECLCTPPSADRVGVCMGIG